MFDELAQQGGGHTCLTSQERNKADLDDFYAIYRGSATYSDSDFKPDSDALYWADMGEDTSKMATEKEPKITWKRAGSAFPKHTLFGRGGVTVKDVEQGWIGDCWFLAAATALAEVPGRIERIFLNNKNEASPNGIYGVNLYSLGVPHTVIVDDWLPL